MVFLRNAHPRSFCTMKIGCQSHSLQGARIKMQSPCLRARRTLRQGLTAQAGNPKVQAAVVTDRVKTGPSKDLSNGPSGQRGNAASDIVQKLQYVVGADTHSINAREAYQGVAWSVRERLIEQFNKTQEYWR